MELYAAYVPVFKALSDETRLKIVEMLSWERCPPVISLSLFKLRSQHFPTIWKFWKSVVWSIAEKMALGCGTASIRKESRW